MNDHSTPSARASAPARVRRRGPGTANRAPYRNEVKSRFDDPTYEALLKYQAIYGIESTSAALVRITRMALLGVIGMLPADISGVSPTGSRVGTNQ